MLSEKPPIPQAELERREQAARNLRARLILIPWYAEQDRRDGMEFWRKLQASAVLSDGRSYQERAQNSNGEDGS